MTMIGGDAAQFQSSSTVKFYKRAVLDEAASKSANEPVFKEADYLMIRHPGEPLNVYDAPVREQDRVNHREQWEAFSRGEELQNSGTPLSELFPGHAGESMVEELRRADIHSIEALAGCTDSQAQNLLWGYQLRDKAQGFLKSRNSPNAQMAALQEQNEILQQRLDEQGEQIANLVETISKLRGKPVSTRRRRRARRAGPGGEPSLSTPGSDAA